MGRLRSSPQDWNKIRQGAQFYSSLETTVTSRPLLGLKGGQFVGIETVVHSEDFTVNSSQNKRQYRAMRLHVHQPTTASPGNHGGTRIVVSDTTSPTRNNQQGNDKGVLSGGCSRLRVRMEIHPISNSNYFHIVLQLLFTTKSEGTTSLFNDSGDETGNGSTDTVELIFLAELCRSSKYEADSHQRSRSEGSSPHTSPPLGKGAFVDLAVGSELFVIHVFSENKPSSKEDGMRQKQSLGLCHRVRVRVSKQSPTEEKTKTGKSSDNKDCGGWLRHLRRPPSLAFRAVTDGCDSLDSIPVADDDSSNPTTTTTTSTQVCLQSWRVKTITSKEIISQETNQEISDHQRGSEATIVADGMENSRVSQGVILNF